MVWHTRKWGGLWSAVACTGGSLENYYCVKPAENSSAISVLVAVAYVVGQRGLKIHKKYETHMLGFS